jgi:O-antigen ligase
LLLAAADDGLTLTGSWPKKLALSQAKTFAALLGGGQSSFFPPVSYSRRNLDWWCERLILALVAGMLVFAPLAFGAVDTWAWLVVQTAAAVVLLLWGARLWLRHGSRLLWPPLAWVVLAFMLYAVVRYFTADIEYVARQEFLQVIVFGFLFLVAVNNLRGQDESNAVSAALIIAGTFSACYAVAQLLHHSNAVWNLVSPYIGRASGTFISPNNLACLLAMLLPLALAYLLVGKVGIVTRLLLAYATLAMAAGLAVTFSRGGYVAAAAGVATLLLVLLGHGNHRWKAVILLLVLLMGGGYAVNHSLSKTVGYMRRVEGESGKAEVMTSAGSRLMLWRAAMQMWADAPLAGVGPGLFDYRFREYRPENLQGRPDRAHNDWLNLLADWGIIGGVIVLAGLGCFIWAARETWPHVRREENVFGTGQSNRFAFFIGAVCALVALAVHSAMDFNLHIPANALAGVLLLALAAGNLRYATERFWFRPARGVKVLLSASLGAAAIFLVFQTVRLGLESHRLAQAEVQPVFSPARMAALEKAFACEPKNFATAFEIGECLRTQCQESGDDRAGEQALTWFATARRLNPHDAFAWLRAGMCLDLLGRTNDSGAYYSAAEARDPNGYYVVSCVGWHYVQTGDYSAAREWFWRSLALEEHENLIAQNYLAICDARLAAQAAGK